MSMARWRIHQATGSQIRETRVAAMSYVPSCPQAVNIGASNELWAVHFRSVAGLAGFLSSISRLHKSVGDVCCLKQTIVCSATEISPQIDFSKKPLLQSGKYAAENRCAF